MSETNNPDGFYFQQSLVKGLSIDPSGERREGGVEKNQNTERCSMPEKSQINKASLNPPPPHPGGTRLSGMACLTFTTGFCFFYRSAPLSDRLGPPPDRSGGNKRCFLRKALPLSCCLLALGKRQCDVSQPTHRWTAPMRVCSNAG